MNLVGCVKIKKRQIFNIFSISWFLHFVTRDFFPIYLGTSHVVVIILTDPSAILEPRHPAISVSELHIKSKMVKRVGRDPFSLVYLRGSQCKISWIPWLLCDYNSLKMERGISNNVCLHSLYFTQIKNHRRRFSLFVLVDAMIFKTGIPRRKS